MFNRVCEIYIYQIKFNQIYMSWNFKKLATLPMNTVKRKFLIEGADREGARPRATKSAEGHQSNGAGGLLRW